MFNAMHSAASASIVEVLHALFQGGNVYLLLHAWRHKHRVSARSARLLDYGALHAEGRARECFLQREGERLALALQPERDGARSEGHHDLAALAPKVGLAGDFLLQLDAHLLALLSRYCAARTPPLALLMAWRTHSSVRSAPAALSRSRAAVRCFNAASARSMLVESFVGK